MRNWQGWLETRLARITLKYLKLPYSKSERFLFADGINGWMDGWMDRYTCTYAALPCNISRASEVVWLHKRSESRACHGESLTTKARPWVSTIQETQTQISEKNKLLGTMCFTYVVYFAKEWSLGPGLFHSARWAQVASMTSGTSRATPTRRSRRCRQRPRADGLRRVRMLRIRRPRISESESTGTIITIIATSTSSTTTITAATAIATTINYGYGKSPWIQDFYPWIQESALAEPSEVQIICLRVNINKNSLSLSIYIYIYTHVNSVVYCSNEITLAIKQNDSSLAGRRQRSWPCGADRPAVCVYMHVCVYIYIYIYTHIILCKHMLYSIDIWYYIIRVRRRRRLHAADGARRELRVRPPPRSSFYISMYDIYVCMYVCVCMYIYIYIYIYVYNSMIWYNIL